MLWPCLLATGRQRHGTNGVPLKGWQRSAHGLMKNLGPGCWPCIFRLYKPTLSLQLETSKRRREDRITKQDPKVNSDTQKNSRELMNQGSSLYFSRGVPLLLKSEFTALLCGMLQINMGRTCFAVGMYNTCKVPIWMKTSVKTDHFSIMRSPSWKHTND